MSLGEYQKKGQVTVFILLGLVLLATIIIGVYISSSGKSAPVERAVPSAQGLDAVDSFVKSCYQDVFEEGIALALSQGGRIYSADGGVDNDELKSIQYSSKKVAYGEIRLSDDSGSGSNRGSIKKDVPLYPWKEFPYTPEVTITIGSTSIPIAGGGLFDVDNRIKSFGDVTLPTLSDMTNTLESYMLSNKAVRCLSFTKFESQGITVSKSGTPLVKVTFGDADSSLAVTNLNIESSKGGEVRKLSSIQLSLPLVVSGLLEAATLVATDDSEFLEYRPEGAVTLDDDSPYTSTVLARGVPGTQDDIISISYAGGILRGEPAKFLYARENRPPMLVLPKEVTAYLTGKAFCYGADQTKFTITDGKFSAEGKYALLPITSTSQKISDTPPISLTLAAYDPDEDTTTIFLLKDTPNHTPDQSPPTQGMSSSEFLPDTNSEEFSIVVGDGLSTDTNALNDFEPFTVEVESCD